jgi:hypothetical protein
MAILNATDQFVSGFAAHRGACAPVFSMRDGQDVLLEFMAGLHGKTDSRARQAYKGRFAQILTRSCSLRCAGCGFGFVPFLPALCAPLPMPLPPSHELKKQIHVLTAEPRIEKTKRSANQNLRSRFLRAGGPTPWTFKPRGSKKRKSSFSLSSRFILIAGGAICINLFKHCCLR